MNTKQVTVQSGRVTTEGDELYYEVRGQGQQLRIKYGVDLTAPHLHIGHAVNLWMMRQLQDMGHKVQFLSYSSKSRK